MAGNWLNLGEMIEVNASKYPDTVCMKDANRSYTYPEVDRRINKLANAISGLGLGKGDKVAVLLENCLEICELYFSACRNGVVIVPIMFRLTGKDIGYIAENSEAKAMVVLDEFIPNLPELPSITPGNRIVVGSSVEDWRNYDEFLGSGSEKRPDIEMEPADTWIMLYTSGTTGVPKGVVRSHESYIAFYLINAIDFDFRHGEMCLNIMPLCHVNSTFFTFNLTYMGGSFYVHPARSFRPMEILDIIEREKINFISLIPTHYNIILNAPREKAEKYDVSSITKLLCSSAPVSPGMKREIMDFFKGVELYEGYGSTEAGIVTTLFPEEQYTKTGSIGRESSATAIIKLLDEDGEPVPPGEVGELYSYGPMLFDEYWKLPEKTAGSFKGKFFTARDMARADTEGYYYIVDRKDNMIITGGEHVYPTEVENILCTHPAVYDAAIIGVPDPKWGEAVKAVVILKEGTSASVGELMDFCRGKLAGYKKPKSVEFIDQDEMPRTGTGKKLHRILRERYTGN